VVEDLRSLCVSVLDNDVESRRQLEDAVTHISQRLSAQDKGQYSREAVALADQRARLREEVRVAKAKLRDARLDEYREVVAGTRARTPCEAARQVAAGQSSDSWIPGSVDPAAALPLTEAEIAELYASHGVLTPSDESDLGHPLPDVKSLMSSPRFERLAAADPLLDRPEWWTNEAEACEPDDLSEAVQRLASLVKSRLAAPGWQRAATAAAMSMDGGQQHWSGLADKLDEAVAFAASCSELLLHHDVRPPEDGTPATHEVVTTGILAFLERKGSFGFLAKLTNRDWARFVSDTRVNGAKPRTEEHFRAIKAEATLRRLRSEVEKRWTGLMEPGGAPSWKDLGPTPETASSQFAAEIRRALDWHARQASPEIERLRDLGLRWDALLEAQAPRTGPQASLERLIAALELAGSVMNGRIDAALVLRRDKEFKALLSRLRSEGAPSSPLQSQLAKATERRDARTYRQVVERVERLAGLQAPYLRRAALLGTLEQIAPGWAAAIRARTGVHGDTTPPGDVRAAWEWAQLHSELESRGSRSLSELQATVHELESRLREVTTRLIDRRAWAAQVQRTDLAQRQALVGWLQLIKRIGKGTGKRVLELRAQAATRMRQCRSAVPVWIMPLSRVADSFDPGTRFDVVIMDEASQSDVMGLVALYLGKKVVVVGDHEQVSPSAVGQQLAPLPQLIEQYLTGIPNSALYDGRTSVYDLAMQSFGGLVCLTEHFRCLPDIIEFSNWLSYRGEIKPLREPSAADVTPYVVPHRVIDGARDGKINISEARHVASLLVACTREPEYAAKTFGVISLLGDEQALVIDRFLREHLDEPEYMRRRVLCGNAAQFQGDERDVIFLSLVHASNGAPLTKLDQPMYQQRFNVAASRARDQLWVTYSLDPATDLQPGDLRRKLIEHALDPGLRARQRQESSINTESDLKRSVLELLVANRFRVRPQHSVGSYRIDMVVQGTSGQRLAVECDGDRSQTLENLAQDMARQAVLERLGWKFVRIRGTQFHRNAEAAMAPVFKRLAELGIEPQAADESPALPSDLHRRVLARAASLLDEWKVTASSDLAPEPVARDVVMDETSID
jgi:very-short-patch-repair endonuclease